jgi:DNA polymerase (family 10)
VDNRRVADALAEIADIFEIKGDNPFKIRAYRSAAETVGAAPDPVALLDEKQLRSLPGIGKDLAARIRELSTTGLCLEHEALRREFPPNLLQLLTLQGVGPRTVAQLYAALGICSVDDLADAARAGRLRSLKGFGPKKEAQILAAVDERTRHAGRHLLPDTAAAAAELQAFLLEQHPDAQLTPVGSLRRGTETCGDIDILASGDGPLLLNTFAGHPHVERVLGHGETKVSVRLRDGYQADLRLVPPDSHGAAMQYFTGSKDHNIALRDLALRQGYTLNEYGLVRKQDGRRVAGRTEEEIYAALGLSWVAPELRENRGELEAAATGTLPSLVELSDLRGDLHMHTTATDGRDDLFTMAAEAHRRGYAYIAITDHSKALAMANGLDERRALAHAAEVRALNGRFDGLTLLAGIECDIMADGTLDLADDCLAELDIVVASVHSHFEQEEPQVTDRLLRALECPWVDVLGHPTGRRLLRRAPLRCDMARVADSAARLGVALEINGQANRLDLGDVHARTARERGASLVISSDAHATSGLDAVRWGVLVARRAWTSAIDVLNAADVNGLRARLRRNRGH